MARAPSPSRTILQALKVANSHRLLLLGLAARALTKNIANWDSVDGFSLYYSNSSTLTGNIASKDGIGFSLDYSNSNTLTKNFGDMNTQTGFYLASSSASNVLSRNTANYNTKYGYDDLSTGSGTEGTANTYTSNICTGNGEGGSSPPWLGSPQP